MIPPFRRNGTLPPGIHWTTWEEFIRDRRNQRKGIVGIKLNEELL